MCPVQRGYRQNWVSAWLYLVPTSAHQLRSIRVYHELEHWQVEPEITGFTVQHFSISCHLYKQRNLFAFETEKNTSIAYRYTPIQVEISAKIFGVAYIHH